MRAPHSYRHDPAVPGFDDSAPVAFMDAECAICTRGARLIHRLDRSGTIRICPVQSDLGAAVLGHYGLAPDDPSSWLLLDRGIAHEGFDALAHLGRLTGGWGRLLQGLRLLPGPLRRWLYVRLARNRYALFGRADMCALPDPTFQARLLG